MLTIELPEVPTLAGLVPTHRHLTVADQHRHLTRQLRGHDAYFGLKGNYRALGQLRY